MSDYETAMEPEWDAPIGLQVTPRAIIECVFWNADAVHTGYESCVDPKLVIVDTIAHEDNGDNYCRYVEQEYVEEEAPEDTTWHDWTVELKLGGGIRRRSLADSGGRQSLRLGLVRAGVREGVHDRVGSREQACSQGHRRRHVVVRPTAAADASLRKAGRHAGCVRTAGRRTRAGEGVDRYNFNDVEDSLVGTDRITTTAGARRSRSAREAPNSGGHAVQVAAGRRHPRPSARRAGRPDHETGAAGAPGVHREPQPGQPLRGRRHVHARHGALLRYGDARPAPAAGCAMPRRIRSGTAIRI